jgi:hypothetical protein
MLPLLLVLTVCGVAHAADVPAAPLPKKARALPDGRFASPLGFRDTVDWYKKELRRQGVNVQVVGPVRYRDVTYVRLLPTDAGASFDAVHIVLADGRTTIYILAASAGKSSESKLKIEELASEARPVPAANAVRIAQHAVVR